MQKYWCDSSDKFKHIASKIKFIVGMEKNSGVVTENGY